MINKNISVVLQKNNLTDVLPSELATAPDSFFTEVLVTNGVLEQTDQNFLQILTAKVRIGGKVILKGTECLEVCRRVYYGELPVNNGYFQNTKNFYSVAALKKVFENESWNIEFMGVNDLNFDFEITRKV